MTRARRVVIALLSLLVLALGARFVRERPSTARGDSLVKTVTFRHRDAAPVTRVRCSRA